MSRAAKCPARTGAHWGGPARGAEATWGPYAIVDTGYKTQNDAGVERYALAKRLPGGKYRLLGTHRTIFQAKVAASKACRPSARAPKGGGSW